MLRAFWKKRNEKGKKTRTISKSREHIFLHFLVIYNKLMFFFFINALSGILLEQGFFYCFLPNPPTPCTILLQSYFSSGAPQKDSVKGRKGGYCSAFLLFIYSSHRNNDAYSQLSQ